MDASYKERYLGLLREYYVRIKICNNCKCFVIDGGLGNYQSITTNWTPADIYWYHKMSARLEGMEELLDLSPEEVADIRKRCVAWIGGV